jgi:hypothetical protein
LATIQDSDLAREIDLGAMGKQSLGYVFTFTLIHNAVHTGEIACLKGQQGVRGYPF